MQCYFEYVRNYAMMLWISSKTDQNNNNISTLSFFSLKWRGSSFQVWSSGGTDE